jgi:hypothetical protein
VRRGQPQSPQVEQGEHLDYPGGKTVATGRSEFEGGALQGCVIVALEGCVIVVLQGCVMFALRGCVIVALQGCIIVVLQGCVIVALKVVL